MASLAEYFGISVDYFIIFVAVLATYYRHILRWIQHQGIQHNIYEGAQSWIRTFTDIHT